jgi:hypothetical protein
MMKEVYSELVDQNYRANIHLHLSKKISCKNCNQDKTMHPTVTDGNIKVVGIHNFPWIVEDNLYKKLRNEYIH